MKIRGGVPVYPDVIQYADLILDQRIWEGDGWKTESLSWKESCYIHSGLSGTALLVTGPEATDFLSKTSTNNVYNWKPGTMKHLVQLNEDGYIANHALAAKDDDCTYRIMACPPWPLYMAAKLQMNVKVEFIPFFVHQISGPKAKEIIEKVTGDDISDVKFLDFRTIRIPGIDADLEVARIGMSGTIAYEIRGNMQYCAESYDAIYQIGKEYGIKRLGWRTYCVNHAEGGFPQAGCSFMYAFEKGYWDMLGVSTTSLPRGEGSDACVPEGFSERYGSPSDAGWGGMVGSCSPSDLIARFRTPYDVGWGGMVKFDHDFIGREALEKIAGDPPRTIVTLEWNQEDVMDVWASMFGPKEEEYKIFELPCLVPQQAGGLADKVLKDGKEVGISSFPTYSYYYRRFISHCTLEKELAEEGTEVIVCWGNYGQNIKEIRATVSRYPYTQQKLNQHYYND